MNAANMLVQLLPGTSITYYGEELGMVDGVVDWEDANDAGLKKSSAVWITLMPFTCL